MNAKQPDPRRRARGQADAEMTGTMTAALERHNEDWLIDREAELMMNGLGEKEAKEMAMQDLHTYQRPPRAGHEAA